MNIILNSIEYHNLTQEQYDLLKALYEQGIALQIEQERIYDAVMEMRLKEQTAKAMDRGNYWNLYCAAKRALYNMIPRERVEQLELLK